MKVYETYYEYNNRYYFGGWYPMQDNSNCIKTTTKVINGKEYIYKQYKMLTGRIDKVKYGSYIER